MKVLKTRTRLSNYLQFGWKCEECGSETVVHGSESQPDVCHHCENKTFKQSFKQRIIQSTTIEDVE